MTALLGDVWKLMHDGASVHKYPHKNEWLDPNDVHVLPWPEKYPYIIIIENDWGQMERSVYMESRQFEKNEDLGDAIFSVWN